MKMSMSKGKKRFLIAGTALLMVGVTAGAALFNEASSVSAVTKVFDGITTKYQDPQVRILEIVPEDKNWTDSNGNPVNYQEWRNQGMTEDDFKINVYSELGYFMPPSKTTSNGNGFAAPTSDEGNGSPENITYTSRGGVHGQPYTASKEPNDPAFTSHAYNLYLYGMVKVGQDSGWSNKIGEYPIYGKSAFLSTFRQDQNCNTLLVANRLVDGYYVPNDAGTGKYKFTDPSKYRLNPNGDEANGIKPNTIYDVTVTQVTLSDNSIEETVSFNSVADVDTSKHTLPQATDGTPIVESADGNGDLDFVETEGVAVPYQLYLGYTSTDFGASLWYNKSSLCKFRNSNWWDEYVMGDLELYTGRNAKNTPYTVKGASSVTPADINAADLIYISGKNGTYVNKGSDISNDVLLAIYNKEINEHKAVMMDYAVYNPDNVGVGGNNLSNLAVLLWQYGQRDLYEKYLNTSTNGTKSHKWYDITDGENKSDDVIELKASALSDPDLWSALKDNMIAGSTGNGNFITGNTYVYNHHRTDFLSPKSNVDALDNFANGDFHSSYTETVVSQGLSAVTSYIERQNSMPDAVQISKEVTPAVCIQYILVSDGVNLANLKATLSILEIEPVPGYLYNTGRGCEDYNVIVNAKNNGNKKAAYVLENRESFVNDYLTDYYKDRMQYIAFTSMTIAEFNGRSEDLVENYDIIYIGDEVRRILCNKDGTPTLSNGKLQWKPLYYYNTGNTRYNQYSWVWNDTDHKYVYQKLDNNTELAELPYYNDNNMIGNIYYNVGDKVNMFTFQTANGFAAPGWLDTDKYDEWANKESVINVRYDSRDITKNKLAKLKEFVDSKALVLVAEDLMGTPTVETTVNGTTTNETVKNTVINPTKVANQTDPLLYDVYGRVDNSSNLYEFLSYGLGSTFDYTTGDYTGDSVAKDNVVAVSDIKQRLVKKEELGEYVSTYKLELNLIQSPTEYSYEVHNTYGYIVSDYYLAADENTGKRTLEYEFTIVADAAIANSDFLANLYIDVNKDGKFSKTQEKVADVSIVVTATGAQAERNEDNTYRLYAGTKYTLKRNIADSFDGLINWKLDIQSTSIGYLHDSKIGYTLVKPYGYDDSTSGVNKQKKAINILQITTNAENHLDMEGALYRYRISGINGNTNNDLWGMYLDNVPGYELYIRTVKISDYESFYNSYVGDTNPLHTQDNFLKDFYVQYTGIDVDGKTTNLNPTECRKGHTTPGTGGAGSTTAVTTNADTMKEKGQRDRQGVDMIVCGFGDSISAFSNIGALQTVENFIKQGKPVLTTHDFLIFRMRSHMQTRVLRDTFGQDKYGSSTNIGTGNYPYNPAWNISLTANPADRRTDNGAGYLHSGKDYTRTNNATEVAAIEGGGKEVVYQPNTPTPRGKVIYQTHGLTNFVIDRFRDQNNVNDGQKSTFSWINADAAKQGTTQNNSSSSGFKDYYVNKINEGQLTSYPYYIPETFKTTTSHAQWFTLDLTSDKDQDGESDVVVWYALGTTDNTGNGENMYNDYIGGSIDPANGFYIYNDGNITYTGAGHANLQSTNTAQEVQLFINTLLAAYSNGVSSPSAGFFEVPDYDANPIGGIVVPYDKNVTQVVANGVVTSDSSILRKTNAANSDYKYKFVDPNTDTNVNKEADGTLVYYRIEDENFVRGDKKLIVNYYLEVQEKDIDADGKYNFPGRGKMDVETLTINNIKHKVVDLTAVLLTYPVKGNLTLDNPLTNANDFRHENPADPNSKITAIRNIDPGRTYGLYLPMSLLKDSAKFNLMLKAQTEISSVSTGGVTNVTSTDEVYETLSVVKADLLDLD